MRGVQRWGSASTTALMTAIAAAGAANGQEDAQYDRQDGALTVEEIVVTARKIEETLQDAPLAVSAFTQEALDNYQINDVNDIARFTSGLSFSQAFGRSTDRPVIRGQSNVLAGVQFGVESGTAYFVDGVYFGGNTIQTLNFDAIERVEVIKGPQSALYGRNTYAGAINFITKTPGNEIEATALGRIAENDEYEVRAGIGGPLVKDLLALRIDGRYYDFGGEFTNQLTGEKVGQEQSQSIAGTVYFTPTPSTSARLRVLYSEQDDGPLPIFLQPAIDNNCLPGFRSAAFRAGGSRVSDNDNQYFCGVIEPRPELVELNTDPLPDGTPDGTAFDGIESEQFLVSLILDHQFGNGWSINSLTGFRDEDNLFGTDSDHSDAFILFGPPGVVEPLFANTNRSDIREWSQEVKIVSPQDKRLRGLLGGYYFTQTDTGVDLTFANPIDGEPFGTPLSAETTIDNWAIFGLVAYDIAETLTITGEFRYQEETKARLEPTENFDRERTFTAFTPRITLDWTPMDDRLVYFTYAEGVKPGGVNGPVGEPVDAIFFDQEQSQNFEVGTKLSFLDRRLTINLAGYYIDASDVQLTEALPNEGDQGGGAVTSVATNQGDAEIVGLEVDIAAFPLRGLALNATYAFTDAEFTSGCDPFEFTLNTGGLLFPGGEPVPACDISGRQLPLGSTHQFQTGFTWRHPLTNRIDYFVSSDLSYESTKFVQVHNQAETGDTVLLSARLGIEWNGFELTGFVRNLTDEDTIPLATRWFDLRHGFAPTGIPFGQLAAQGQSADTSFPRGFFGTLRRGRTFGGQIRYTF
mgnify:CR=1 FL=1